MTPEELKALQKEVRKAKRIATEKAGELHDLVEDRLPSAYEETPVIAQATRMDQLRAVAEAGGLMPQKSTFFFPKVATGLIINPLND